MKELLKKVKRDLEPFSWFNYDHFPDSKGHKLEIYLDNTCPSVNSLIHFFYDSFNSSNLVVGQYNLQAEWGQFCLETWDFEKDKSDYGFTGKSIETIDYLNFLLESNIEFSYRGLCCCVEWDTFLKVTLNCIINHKAPYSPLFYDFDGNYLFYFHHSYSVGFYFKEYNKEISEILEKFQKGNCIIEGYIK